MNQQPPPRQPVIRRRRLPGTEIPRKILIGIIADTHFAHRMLPRLKPQHFGNDVYAMRIVRWVDDYVKSQGSAPTQNIQTIYHVRKAEVSEEEAEGLEKYLLTLSKQAETSEGDNWEHFFDIAATYAKAKDAVELAERLRLAGEMQDMVAVERIQAELTTLPLTELEFEDTGDPQVIADTLNPEEDVLFKLRGQIGDLIGPICRGWFIAITGPFKRGKTSFLIEWITQGLQQHLKTVVFSFEMTAKDYRKRIYQRMIALPEYPGEYRLPVWDCLHNQEDTCRLPYRTCNIGARRQTHDKDSTITFDTAPPEYHPCTYCKDKAAVGLDQEYEPASWYRTIAYEKSLPYAVDGVVAQAEHLAYSSNLVIIALPGLDMDAVRGYLRALGTNYGFYPDMIMFDFLDLMESKEREYRHRINDLWMNGARLAKEFKAAVFTPSQSTKKGIKAKVITEEEAAPEDTRKLGHVDVWLTINQTKGDAGDEDDMLRARIRVLEHRHRRHSSESATILQAPEIGQFITDSYVPSVNRRQHQKGNSTLSTDTQVPTGAIS